MKLSALVAQCDLILPPARETLDLDVTGVAYDSRQVTPGDVFVAVRGLQSDGNRFVDAARRNGAAAVVSALPPGGSAVPWVQVRDDRKALACIGTAFYGHPTRDLHLVGITGTNGKTTTSYLVESIVQEAGAGCAVFGTINYRGPGFTLNAERTTPESPDLNRLFRQVIDAGWKYAVMEVSSHAVALERVTGLRFEVAVFTNLTRDHLDFHGDMESYFAAKKRLFTGVDGSVPAAMVLNRDDPRFGELQDVEPGRVISYGLSQESAIQPVTYRFDASGTDAVFRTPLGDIAIRSSLSGTPNLYNIGAACGVGVALGFPAETIRRGIERLPGVPGRFEIVNAGQPYRVIVDYAHTHDALDRLLETAREITPRRLITVFGCGGDRDRTKRPLMGEVAGRRSDFVIVTSDNPRTEDPVRIIQEVEEGLRRTTVTFASFPDRRDAIRAALQSARPDDTVVIAGKGHETYQVIGETEVPFDDREVVRELWNASRPR